MKFKERINFLRSFINDKNIASVTPSSQFSVKKLCRKIDFSKDNVIVEYGPGNGVFTRYLLSKMTKRSTLIAIETNMDFVKRLKKIKAPQLKVVHDSAENVQRILHEHGHHNADYVIAGIPFSYLEEHTKQKILYNTKQALSPRGKFLIYQFLYSLKKNLKEEFKTIHQDFEFRNVPPLFIFEAVKERA